MEPFETYMNGDFRVEIFTDHEAENPREEYDHLGAILHTHPRYDLGVRVSGEHEAEVYMLAEANCDSYCQCCGERVYSDGSEWVHEDEDSACWEKRVDLSAVVVLPVFAYEHGGITLSTSEFSDPWDSGQVGVIFVPVEKVIRNLGKGTGYREARFWGARVLGAEIREFDQFLQGDVWGYRITYKGDAKKSPEQETLWGVYGLNNCRKEADGITKIMQEELKEQATSV